MPYRVELPYAGPMKYVYWLAAALLIGGGLYISTQLQLQPPSTPIMPFSEFSQPEEWGQAVAKKLRPQLDETHLVFLGVTPNQVEDMEFWKGFLAELSATGLKYDLIIAEPFLAHVDLLQPNVKMDLKMESSRFVEGVKEALGQNLRTIVVVPTIYSSQLLIGNPASRLNAEHQLDFISLSLSKFPLTAEQDAVFEPLCVGEKGLDNAGTGKLGCSIRQLARRLLRKKLSPEKYSGLVEQVGDKDYLILFNRN